ncbi:MAG TPA: hypothetical protein TECP_00549 [Hyphomicrobiaceae bacterium MAG_BT-2024]
MKRVLKEAFQVDAHPQHKLVIISAIKSLILVSVCIFINLLGILTSELTDNILLFDFSGTIAIAMIYGPIHASLVGIISTYIGQMFMPELIFAASSHRFANYFIFAPVHMVIGMVVFLVPRTMHRTMAANLFSGNKKKISCWTVADLNDFAFSANKLCCVTYCCRNYRNRLPGISL